MVVSLAVVVLSAVKVLLRATVLLAVTVLLVVALLLALMAFECRMASLWLTASVCRGPVVAVAAKAKVMKVVSCIVNWDFCIW